MDGRDLDLIRSDGAPDGFYRDDAPGGEYEAMSDNEVIDLARHVYGRFRVVPRWDAENDGLLREWGAVCREMGRRGITDTVTEAGPVDVIGMDPA